jgi:SAM-dependent methyltransferase
VLAQPVYDRIGGQYREGRREEPRIAAAILGALGGASPVLNVGAGAGSYEPRDRLVVAVEPSAVMVRQRPHGAAPAVRAQAEALPFGDGTFGAAMAVLTVHHWTDRARGLAEVRRVADGPVVLFVRDPRVVPAWWLHHYFPASRRLEARRETPLDQFARLLGRPLEVIPVPVPANCADGFSGAYWRRPRAYLDRRVWRPISALALIPDADREEGMRRLRADLDNGEWHRRYGHLLVLDELDLGYRVVVAAPGRQPSGACSGTVRLGQFVRSAMNTNSRPGRSGASRTSSTSKPDAARLDSTSSRLRNRRVESDVTTAPSVRNVYV